MAFNISSINIQFQNGKMEYVTAYFNQRRDNGRDYLSGHIELSVDEYLQNTSTESLTSLVKQKVTDFVNEEELPEDTGSTTGSDTTESDTTAGADPEPSTDTGSEAEA